MLEVDLRRRLSAIEIDIAFKVERGECLALVGPSGAGKSSILRMIAGLLRSENGRVVSHGDVWQDHATGRFHQPEQRSCGMLFQDYALFDHLPAWRNVAFALPKMPRAAKRHRATELLDRFSVAKLADSSPRALSGGERQRVALARALARDPAVLLLDEPFSALDVRAHSNAVRTVAETIATSGSPTVLVSHDFTEAALVADRICVVDDGVAVQAGAAADLIAKPASEFVANFTGANVLRGQATPRGESLTEVALDGGGHALVADNASGPVAIAVNPWEITIETSGEPPAGSARNRLQARVEAVTPAGGRLRVGLASPHQLVAEVTAEAGRELGLAPGVEVGVSWKATATRLLTADLPTT